MVLLFVTIIVIGFAVYRRMSLTENEASSMPKWSSSTNSESGDSSSDDNDENQIWNE